MEFVGLILIMDGTTKIYNIMYGSENVKEMNFLWQICNFTSSLCTYTVRIGVSGKELPSVSSTSVNHSSLENCGGLEYKRKLIIYPH